MKNQEFQEIQEQRQILFESIEWKLNTLYHATRSIRHAEEMREYILTVLSLMRDYLDIHKDHFELKKLYRTKRISHDRTYDLLESTNYRILESLWIKTDSIERWSGRYVRQHVIWLFRQILEIHCMLEEIDYVHEYNKRFIELRSFIEYKTVQKKGNRRGRSGAWRLSSWQYWFWSRLEKWSWKFMARYEYDCINCPEKIYRWQYYNKEVIRMDDSLEVFRSHICCPHDPCDPRDRDEVEDIISTRERRVA